MSADLTLTSEEQTVLRDAQRQVRELRAVVDRLERAGLDVTAERAELDRAEQLATGLLKEFGGRRGSSRR